MGNSNSIAQFTPNEVDLRQRAHWQYLSQQRASFQPNTSGGGGTNSTSIKVLPELKDTSGHLRPTDNGVILFNGGTISARGRESSVGVVRSKSISSPQHEAQRYMLQRHHTQLDMPGVRSSTTGIGLRRDVDPKLFGSEPDLRLSPGDAGAGGRNSRKFKGQNGHPQNQQQHNQQIQRDYDSTRFGWRPKSHQHHPQQQQQLSNHQHHHNNRDRMLPPIEAKKQRLFKTREETKKVSSKANQSKLATEASDVQSKKPSSSRQSHGKREKERSRDDSTTDRVIKVIGNPPVPEKLLPKAEVLSKPIFRREKSFDISLLLSRGAHKGTSLFPNVFRKSSATTDKHPPVIQVDKLGPTEIISGEDKMGVKTRRASQPPPRMNDKDFQKELQEATRRRSMLVPLKEDNATKSSVNGQKSIVTQSPVLKAMSKPPRERPPQQQPLKSKAPKPPQQPQSPKVEANKIQLEIRNGGGEARAVATTTSHPQSQSVVSGGGGGDGRKTGMASATVASPEEVSLTAAAEKPVKSFFYGMPEKERNNAAAKVNAGIFINGNGTATPTTGSDSMGSPGESPRRKDSGVDEMGGTGNEEERRRSLEELDGEEKVELTAIESFAESIFAMKKQQNQQNHQQKHHQQRESSESAVSSFAEDPVTQHSSSLLLYPGQKNHHQHHVMGNNVSHEHFDMERGDEDTLEGISLQLRPTLPKKQFEIPRFSPAAAWRLLSTAETREMNQLNCLDQLRYHEGKDDNRHGDCNGDAADDDDEQLKDDREESVGNQESVSGDGGGADSTNEERQIERIYREPVPGLADNKSGDSGISGDGGLELGDSSPTNNLLVNDLRKLGPFLQPWTPQQDLEDDSSSDPEPEEQLHNQHNINNNITDNINHDNHSLKSHCRTIEDVAAVQKHVFSLSLPRDSNNNHHQSNLSDKGVVAASDKHFFSSLQKTGRGGVSSSQQAATATTTTSLSGNDNWFLGRSQPNSIEKNPMPSLSDNEEISLPKITAQQQPAIQPPSFNYLAGGCHFMYLPNRPTTMSVATTNSHNLSINGAGAGSTASLHRQQAQHEEKVNNGPMHSLPPPTVTRESSSAFTARENLQDDEDNPSTPMTPPSTTTVWNLPYRMGGRKGHRFTFQSTVRQIERRKLADKLSREAEEREAQRLSELEAMQKVEEEFQKKRAREKASIRQQLRLFSMESQTAVEINPSFGAKPSEMIGNQFGDGDVGEYSPSSIRREPDGAAEATTTTMMLSKMNGACHNLSSTSLLLELNGYNNHSQRQQQQQQPQQPLQYPPENYQYQSMATSTTTNILTRDYSKFPYREFLK